MGNDHQNDLHIPARAIDIHNREVYRREHVTVAVDTRSFSYRWSAELSVRLESFAECRSSPETLPRGIAEKKKEEESRLVRTRGEKDDRRPVERRATRQAQWISISDRNTSKGSFGGAASLATDGGNASVGMYAARKSVIHSQSHESQTRLHRIRDPWTADTRSTAERVTNPTYIRIHKYLVGPPNWQQ